jgi:hypothetical protein
VILLLRSFFYLQNNHKTDVLPNRSSHERVADGETTLPSAESCDYAARQLLLVVQNCGRREL